ncbi:hypothetical protein ACQUY5_18665 [Bacillus cereus]|uniref:hypothetical protein n=1 Tax=Bacillus cereus TaxID=1396 RepID=UPI003D17C435
MECPYCGGSLDYNTTWYTGLYGREDYHERGIVYKCPNWQKFNDEEERQAYIEKNKIQVGKDQEFESVEEVICKSHNECNGDFYTDGSAELIQGNPC